MTLKKSLKGVNPQDISALGLDVAKAKIDICFLSKNQTISYQIANNSQAISCFSKELKIIGLTTNVPFVLESTGNYHLLLAKLLNEDNWNVKEINPIITHQYIKHTVRGTKTDTTDAKLLAKIGLIEGENLKSFDRNLSIINMRMLISYLAHLEKTIQKTKTSFSTVKKGLETLGLSMGYELAKMQDVIKMLEERAEGIKQEILAIPLAEEEQEKIDRLDSIIGITPFTARVSYALFAHNDFKTKGAMLAYVGLDPKLKQSGTKKGVLRVSKRGNPYIRKKLFQAAFCGKQHFPYFQSIYNKNIMDGKHHFEAVLAVSKKIVYIMRALLKNKTQFDHNYHKLTS